MGVKYKNTEIELIKGDITETEAEAIVNSSNTDLTMERGVAKMIKEKAGEDVEKQAMMQAPIHTGEVVMTEGGNLKVRCIIHTATVGHDGMADIIKIRGCTENSLALADEKQIKTIAFPAMGTGYAQFPEDLCAETMLKTIQRHLDKKQSQIERIILVLYEEEIYDIFQKKLKEIF